MVVKYWPLLVYVKEFRNILLKDPEISRGQGKNLCRISKIVANRNMKLRYHKAVRLDVHILCVHF